MAAHFTATHLIEKRNLIILFLNYSCSSNGFDQQNIKETQSGTHVAVSEEVWECLLWIVSQASKPKCKKSIDP